MATYTLANTEVDHTRRTAPICIIGSGLAGLLIAIRLGKAGHRVIVIESGLDGFDDTIHKLNIIDDSLGPYSRALTGRYREFGGNSRYWGGRLIPLTSHDLAARPYLSVPEWPFSITELATYQSEVEKLFGLDTSSYEEDLLEQLDPDKYFLRGDPDLTCRWFKCPTFRRTNLAAKLKHELERFDNVEIWLGATVCDFEIDRDRGRLSGVVAKDFSGRKLTVTANEFICAAGAIETTRLLLVLDALSDHRAFQGCDALGRYFQEHPRVVVGNVKPVDPVTTNKLFGYRFIGPTRRNLYLELTPSAQRSDEVASAYAEVSLDLASGSPLELARSFLRGLQKRQLGVSTRDLGRLAAHTSYFAKGAFWRLVRRQMLLPSNSRLKLEITIEQAPDPNNRITLSHHRDQLGVPMAKLDWRLTDQDERTFRSALRRTNEYWRRSGLERICPIEWTEYARDSLTRLADAAYQAAHPSGSTRMGIDPRTSVVGPDLHCHHVPNIRLVSASTFPSAGSINPTMTILQLALRAADALLQRPSLLS